MLYIPFAAIALVLLFDAIPWYTTKKRQKKETSGRMWTRVIIVIGLIAIVWWGLFTPWINKDWVSEVEGVSVEPGKATAYIAYYPGRSGFQKDMANAFAQGLVANGWSVEISTASSKAPTDMSNYDLVVLGSPTYILKPAQRMLKYIATLNLTGKNVVVIASGLASTSQSVAAMEQAVRAVGGEPIKAVELRTGSGMEGIANPKDVAIEAAKAIALPQ
jgi:flavodoxin